MKQYLDSNYYVSEDGHIYTKGKMRAEHPSNRGYPCVTLHLADKNKRVNIHRLVAQLYVPNPGNLPCVNHIDGNKSNNHYTNLEWVDYKTNSHHSFYTLRKQIGEDHCQAKVPNKIVTYLRKCFLNGKIPNYERIALTYGVGVQHIKNIYKGKKRIS